MRDGRVPIRAAFAFAGAGSLGTFLAGAMRETVLAIWEHNHALQSDPVDENDERLLHPTWGHITIDAIGGSSAGALCGAQLVRALFEPEYLGKSLPIDEEGSVTGDWIEKASFSKLSTSGNQRESKGPIANPGWSLLSGSALYEVACETLNSDGWTPQERVPWSPLDPSGLVAIGITMTDLIGYHEYADFEVDAVLGHPSFGAVAPAAPHYAPYAGGHVRDLGIRKHSEVRKVFVGLDREAVEGFENFLGATNRLGRARGITWRGAAQRLASLTTASAALPLAIGPVSLTDQVTSTDATVRRLYMDGGVLNNKPIAPALALGRWQDEVRLVERAGAAACGDEPRFQPEDVEDVLCYQRVCFFIDAFPDRTKRRARSPHPDEALRRFDRGAHRSGVSAAARDEAIDSGLSSPTRGLGALFDSMLTSLRAQDIRGIAGTNFAIRERDAFISRLVARLVARGGAEEHDFKLTTINRAHAYAAVRAHPEGAKLSVYDALSIAELVWESNRISGLNGRRGVVMVPVFAPENLVAVLAGEALYALGGLLSRKARVHDASVGRTVARSVMQAIDPRYEAAEINLQDAPEDALPTDTTLLVDRLRVAVEAAIQGDRTTNPVVRALVMFPFKLNPLVRLIKTRLDATVKGLPTKEEDTPA